MRQLVIVTVVTGTLAFIACAATRAEFDDRLHAEPAATPERGGSFQGPDAISDAGCGSTFKIQRVPGHPKGLA